MLPDRVKGFKGFRIAPASFTMPSLRVEGLGFRVQGSGFRV